jgi:hypothetical protein
MISGDELMLSFHTIGIVQSPHHPAWTFVRDAVDRFRHPAARPNYRVTFTLEDVSPSTVRVRYKLDNREIIFCRVDSIIQSALPR